MAFTGDGWVAFANSRWMSITYTVKEVNFEHLPNFNAILKLKQIFFALYF
jgi:hypothetical protein